MLIKQLFEDEDQAKKLHRKAVKLWTDLAVNGYDKHIADNHEEVENEYRKLTGKWPNYSAAQKRYAIPDRQLPRAKSE